MLGPANKWNEMKWTRPRKTSLGDALPNQPRSYTSSSRSREWTLRLTSIFMKYPFANFISQCVHKFPHPFICINPNLRKSRYRGKNHWNTERNTFGLFTSLSFYSSSFFCRILSLFPLSIFPLRENGLSSVWANLEKGAETVVSHLRFGISQIIWDFLKVSFKIYEEQKWKVIRKG